VQRGFFFPQKEKVSLPLPTLGTFSAAPSGAAIFVPAPVARIQRPPRRGAEKTPLSSQDNTYYTYHDNTSRY
jgi:hypothetical protein